jgi:hypothetical protein
MYAASSLVVLGIPAVLRRCEILSKPVKKEELLRLCTKILAEAHAASSSSSSGTGSGSAGAAAGSSAKSMVPAQP